MTWSYTTSMLFTASSGPGEAGAAAVTASAPTGVW
jgi:hypothetical protein